MAFLKVLAKRVIAQSEISLFCIPLKKILVKDSKCFRSTAFHFYGTSLLDKKINEHFNNSCSRNNIRTDTETFHQVCRHNDIAINELMDQLKVMIPNKKPLLMVAEKFLIALHSTICYSDKSRELLSLLLDLNNKSFSLSKEKYLNDLINATQCLITSSSEGRLYTKFSKVYANKNKNYIRFVKCQSAIKEADWMLDTIFVVSSDDPHISEENEKFVSTLMFESIELIESCIQYVTLEEFRWEKSLAAFLEQLYAHRIRNSMRKLDSFRRFPKDFEDDQYDVSDSGDGCYTSSSKNFVGRTDILPTADSCTSKYVKSLLEHRTS